MLNKYVTAAATSCVQKYVCVFYRDGKKGEERYGLGCGCWDHKGLGVEMGGGAVPSLLVSLRFSGCTR